MSRERNLHGGLLGSLTAATGVLGRRGPLLWILCGGAGLLTAGLACANEQPGAKAEVKAEAAPRAEADKPARPLVAVMDMPKIQPALIKALKANYEVLPPAQWNTTAKQLNATGFATDEISVVATELKVAAVVVVTLKKDKEGPGWVLTLLGRHGPSGKVVDKKKYPLKSQRIDKATLAQLAEDVGPIVDKALKGKQEEPVAVLDPVAPTAPGQPPTKAPGNEDEDPIKRMAKADEEEARRKAHERPKWYPYIDIGVGIGIEGRRFYFEEDASTGTRCYDFEQLSRSVVATGNPVVYQYKPLSSCPGFRTSVAPMIRVDATVYPLAWVAANAVRGLGLGVTADFPIWPDSKGASMNPLQTTEMRIEGGLRWNWNFLNRRDRPSLLLMLQYGLHSFAIQKEVAQRVVPNQDTTTCSGMSPPGCVTVPDARDDHGQPDINYQYVDIGLGVKVPVYTTDRTSYALGLDVHYHALLGQGEIGTSFNTPMGAVPTAAEIQELYRASGYGPVSGSYGFRVGLTPVDWIVWKGLTVRLTGFYEVFAMSFDLANPNNNYLMPQPSNRTQVALTSPAARHIAQGAMDHFFGTVAQIGWQY